MSKPIICLDFDGVIHQYNSKWTDDVTITDDITEGFFEWAEQAAQHFKLVIYSSRSKNPEAIKSMALWLKDQRKKWREKGGKHEIESPLEFEFADSKPPAFLTIDDRAMQFTGDWRKFNITDLLTFKPWNKK